MRRVRRSTGGERGFGGARGVAPAIEIAEGAVDMAVSRLRLSER